MVYYLDAGVVKSNIRKLLALGLALAFTLALMLGRGADAAVSFNYTFFGEASLVQPGNASANGMQMTSDASPGFGGASFADPSGLTVADLNNLATDFNVTDDNCGGGGPRFQVRVDMDGNGSGDANIFIYLGPPPSYNLCTPGWQNSGNLVDAADLVDSSQLGGTFYDPWANVELNHGAKAITAISLVTDGGFTQGDGEQTIWADNVAINDTLYTFEPAPTKEDCKKGGWQNFTSDPGPFKNQGDCVSHFARQQN